jgi:hypothetical protein
VFIQLTDGYGDPLANEAQDIFLVVSERQHQRPLKKEEYGPIANDSTRKPLTTYFYNAILPKDVGNPSESLCQDIATKR